MKSFPLVLILSFFLNTIGLSQNSDSLPIAQGGEYEIEHSACISDIERAKVVKELKSNTDRLISEGLLSSSRTAMTTLFDWPIRQATGFNYNSVYAISNYIDQDLTYPNNLLDYNCGQRTYDTNSGYNHRGTDIFTWPFKWHMMNDGQAEVIAAAAGTIIGRYDGNVDNNCNFNNPNWNAVYIQHADGSVAWYGHMKTGSVTSKTIGQTVVSGEYLGVVGSSGSSTDPHLHFEVWTDNTYTTLVDPWSGTCNSMTSTGWWNNQKPYRESTLNHLMTNSTPVTFNNCPTPANKNEENIFLTGSIIYFTTFFHDQQVNQTTQIRILQPDGTLWVQWNHTSPNTYSASWWWWWRSFPGTEPTGTWTFEVTYQSETFTHDFQIVSTLPVELLSFEGEQETDKVLLNWETDNEINNDYFVLERSVDGVDFQELARIEGLNAENTINEYSFIDELPEMGKNYYRLKQVDLDGKYEYSKVILVDFLGLGSFDEISIFPNPVINGQINIMTTKPHSELKNLNIYNLLGKKIKEGILLSGNQQEVDLSFLSKSVLIFEVESTTGTFYHKVMID